MANEHGQESAPCAVSVGNGKEHSRLCKSCGGGVIYDPFMGSGTTALAVLMERGERSYIGSEISERYVAMAERKLKDFRQQLTLF